MTSKIVFISYSHDSDEHREKVLALSERLRADGLETRLDQYLNGTPVGGWPRWMLNQVDEADSVLVVSTETYYRRFRGHEVPGKGKGVDWEGTLITQELYDARSTMLKFVPVMLESGQENFIPEPLRSLTHYTLTSEASYQALYDFLLGQAGVEPGRVGEAKTKPRRTASPLIFDEPSGGESPRTAPTRLTHGAATLFGRDAELKRLDAAWIDPETHLVTLVAWGGIGKTSLVAKWAAQLAARDYDGASYFDWSFYSQGTRETGGPSSDTFIATALKFFGDAEMAHSSASAWDKGARLAQLVASRRTLLVLDGLEPLQHPPGPLTGQLKDPAVTTLLKGLAATNPGLCLVTTRESVADLVSFRDTTAPEWNLGRLSMPAGVELLKTMGVHGADDELLQLVGDVKGHALTLNLLGTFLRDAHGGDVRQRDRMRFEDADDEVQGGHAFRVMAAYERWLASEGEKGERLLAILRLLGLFDRPVSADCLVALRRPPVITGLTESIVSLGDALWNISVSRLVSCGLVSPSSSEDSPINAHPLVREYFARQLREHGPDAWRDAHGRLFEHLQENTEYQPASLESLQPLYQAVSHGCLAGKQQEACDNVYLDRISRGSDAFVVKNLGAIGTDLGAIACFFESPWSRTSPSLTAADQAWLLNQAAFRLRALGRLTEALEPMRIGLEMGIAQEHWGEAARRASNLCKLELTLGDVPGAVRDAEQSLIFANRADDAFMRMVSRTKLADSLHQAGQRVDALAHFRETEEAQAERQPAYPLLYSEEGFLYCDLLLADAERAACQVGSVAVSTTDGGKSRHGACAPGLEEICSHVEQRATQTLQWAEQNKVALLDFGLNHLTLGRVGLYRAILEGLNASDVLAESAIEIEQAVSGLRHAGQLDNLPRGLLTRAWLRSLMGDANGARADLDEAWEIAERGPMPLHQADVHLHRARLLRDRDALAEARRLIERHGYGRRVEELTDAEEASKQWSR